MRRIGALPLCALTAAWLAGCSFNVTERTDRLGRKAVSVDPVLSLMGNTAPDCPYRLSTTHRCYRTLDECRAAGQARRDATGEAFDCAAANPFGGTNDRGHPAEPFVIGPPRQTAPITLLPVTLLGINPEPWLGMSLALATSTYRGAKIEPKYHPRITHVTLETVPPVDYKDKGKLFRVAQAIFVDETLIAINLSLGFAGKTKESALSRAEIRELQNDVITTCYGFYAVADEKAIRRSKDDRFENLEMTWNKTYYTANLALPTESLGRLDLIANVGATANKRALGRE